MSTAVYGPYAPFRAAAGFVFISGQVGIDPATGKAAASVEEQTRQALQNLLAVLHKAGLTPADVVKTTVFMMDIGQFAAMNETYVSFFETVPRPARTTVGVAALPEINGQKLVVEIEAICHKGGKHA